MIDKDQDKTGIEKSKIILLVAREGGEVRIKDGEMHLLCGMLEIAGKPTNAPPLLF
jgi:hypothetical protein